MVGEWGLGDRWVRLGDRSVGRVGGWVIGGWVGLGVGEWDWVIGG